jgi:hypothetical protein
MMEEFNDGMKLLRLVGLTLLVLVFMAGRAHCTTTAQRSNSIGATTYNTNPYTYLPVDNVIEVTDIDGSLNFRVHPVGTYMLFDQNILLCGHPDKFDGANYPFLMTYETIAHRTVRGVACHNLVRIDNIEPKAALNK